MRNFGKRTVAIAVTATVLLGGGAAYAFWTAGGTGTGTATTGTVVPVTVNQTSAPITTLAPGATAQPLSGTFTNTNGAVHITSLATVVTTNKDPLKCLAADYVIGGTLTIVGDGPNNDILKGSGGTWSGLTIQLTNTAKNQDECKGAIVTIAYTAI